MKQMQVNTEKSNQPSDEVVSPPGVSVPHCDLQHSSGLLVQMEVKLLPPLWTQGLWHSLQTHTHTDCWKHAFNLKKSPNISVSPD